MASEGDLIAIRMKLLGGKEAAAEAEAASTAIKETGDAAEEASAKSSAASKKVAATSANAARATKKQISAVRALGGGLTKWVTGPLVAIAGASVYMASTFKRQMGLIATDAGGSMKEVVGLEKSVISLSRESQYGPKELAEALFHIESSGYRGAKAMEVLRQSTRLATAGNSDLEKTTYGLVSAQKTIYGKGSVTEVKKTASELNAIVAHGDIRLEELVAGMSSGLIEKANQAGVSLRSVGSALDVMTARGIPAQRASYALGFIFSKLVPYTGPAVEAFEELGIQQEKLSKIAHGPGGWPAMIEFLKGKLKGLTKAQQSIELSKMFGGGRMDVAVLASLQNISDLNKNFKELAPNVALYDKHVKEAEQQPMIKMKMAWASIQASLVELGGYLLPIVVPAFQAIAHDGAAILGWVSKLPAPAQHAFLIFAGIAALAGPMLLFAGSIAKAVLAVGELAGAEMGSNAATGGSGIAGVLGGGLVKAIPYAFAAAGVGSIVVNAVSGETKKAIAGGAGAAIGGALGLAIGGPMGAALGIGIGSFAGPMIEGLFDKPTESVMLRETKHLASAMSDYKASIRGIPAAEDALTQAKKRHRKASHEEIEADRQLRHALVEYGAGSRQANRAQLKLADAQERVTRTGKREAEAHRLAGNALKLYREDSVKATASIKQLLPAQRQRIAHLNQENRQGKLTHEGLEQLVALEKRFAGEKHELTQVYAQAEQKAGKPWAHRLEELTTLQSKYGNKGKVLISAMGETRVKMEQLKAEGLTQQFREENRELEKMVRLYEQVNELGTFQGAGLGKGPKNHPTRKPGGGKPKGHGGGGGKGGSTGAAAQSRRTGPASSWTNHPDSRPTEYFAPAGDAATSSGGVKHMQPIIVQVGRRTVATVVAEANSDDEARL